MCVRVHLLARKKHVHFHWHAQGICARRFSKHCKHDGIISVIGMIARAKLEIGEISVLITVSSPHRGESFAACQYAIDRLKQVVPIWKKEVGEDGESWVEGPHAAHAET